MWTVPGERISSWTCLLPPLGASDHHVIYLCSKKPQTRAVKVRMNDSILSLEGCFDFTIWDVFKTRDIDEQVISDYCIYIVV